ncbi:MAG: tetratricopeptide repeat protein [Xanthobacteraceae bacterium]
MRGKSRLLSQRNLNVLGGFSVACFAIVTRLALGLSRFIENRKLENGAAFIAVALAIFCAATPSATAAGRARDYASVHRQSVAAILARAQRGDAAAEARLGWLYSTGRGVPQDYFEAAKWFYRAANRGNAGAQFALGMAYNKGQGVPRDYVLSYLWLNLSAAQAAEADRDFKTTMRDAIASKMTPQQLLTAQQLSLKWAKSH